MVHFVCLPPFFLHDAPPFFFSPLTLDEFRERLLAKIETRRACVSVSSRPQGSFFFFVTT